MACGAGEIAERMRWYTTCTHAVMNSSRFARTALGGMLVFAGISHLTFARRAFRAQVPDWVPLDRDDTVIASGAAEIALGASLVSIDKAHRSLVGKIAAAFFVAVFPGNLSQFVNRRNAFGLDTDAKRFARLFVQPALVYWALKSTQTEASRG